ncbi:MAG: hypothetical protein ACR2PG_24195 [Hyphomicrobiaceae bacterium]
MVKSTTRQTVTVLINVAFNSFRPLSLTYRGRSCAILSQELEDKAGNYCVRHAAAQKVIPEKSMSKSD